MTIVAQMDTEVKADVDALMQEPCPHCGIKGYVSVGGIGDKITAKCGLCGFTWNPMELDYIFGDPPPYGCACVLPEQHCPDCEAAARTVYDNNDGELLF